MLRRSSASRSPPDYPKDGHGEAGSSQNGEDEVDSQHGRLTITSNGVRIDATERTPLLGKDVPFKIRHPDWIRGQPDLERQEAKRRVSWPRLRNVILWPKEKGYNIARIVVNPKSWNRRAIWANAVMAPVSCLPAVILGVLLNILDALSYGKFIGTSQLSRPAYLYDTWRGLTGQRL